MKNVSLRAITIALVSSFVLMLVSPSLFAEQHAPHWSYEGEKGPEYWGGLADEYTMCSRGLNQSPINLVAALHADLPQLVFDYYSKSILDEVNNGHTIQQNVQPGSFLRIPDWGMNFALKQFHFHSPSEHTVNGESFAMELHFVHTDENGSSAVVGVFIDEGEEHPVLSKMWSFMPENAGETSVQSIGIEETDLLPSTREYFTYGGSLTTPPCSEGVKWMVLKTPIEASVEQIAIFKARVGPITNRPIQPPNARVLVD
ncbi:MAG: carbonic anhydrase family protein [Gammaproteobacteria bacterium]|nr:carbonic anhydrase family protein [Gammaproteobacteria bacterium]